MVDERHRNGAVRRLERWEDDGHSRRRVQARNRVREDVLPVYRPVGARRDGRTETEASRDERGRRKRRAEWGGIEPYSRWQAADHEDDVVLVRPLERRHKESPQVAEEVATASEAGSDKRLAATVAKARAVADELAKKQVPVPSAPQIADQTRDDDYMSASFIITENDDKAERLRRRKKADQQKPTTAGKQANAPQPQAQAALAQYYYSSYYAQQYYYPQQPYATAQPYDPRLYAAHATQSLADAPPPGSAEHIHSLKAGPGDGNPTHGSSTADVQASGETAASGDGEHETVAATPVSAISSEVQQSV